MITHNVYSEYNLSEIRGLEYELKLIHFWWIGDMNEG